MKYSCQDMQVIHKNEMTCIHFHSITYLIFNEQRRQNDFHVAMMHVVYNNILMYNMRLPISKCSLA